MNFDTEFDLNNRSLDELVIKETIDKNNCYISDVSKSEIGYNVFKIYSNSRSKVVCVIKFYRSSITNKYIPRLTFERRLINNDIDLTASERRVVIDLNDSENVLVFWNLVHFLFRFKEIIDLGDFEKNYSVVSGEYNNTAFAQTTNEEKNAIINKLINNPDFNSKDFESLKNEKRKQDLECFFNLLKDRENERDKYMRRYNLREGLEYVWQHFLENNDWVLGLNVDIIFIHTLYPEMKVGSEDSLGRSSPKVDFLGISNYTTLIELKHCDTKIFKDKKTSKARSSTWDFTPDFIEGLSQVLAQKSSHQQNPGKDIIYNDEILDKNITFTVDPKAFFIIGNRKSEFPHINNQENKIKSRTFELFRRNSRNIDIITYDELFERAYHIVYSKKLPLDWYDQDFFPVD